LLLQFLPQSQAPFSGESRLGGLSPKSEAKCGKCLLSGRSNSNAKGTPKLCDYSYPFQKPHPFVLLQVPQRRSLVRQVDPGKMQIFVKYMRVKIVVLHYPFN